MGIVLFINACVVVCMLLTEFIQTTQLKKLQAKSEEKDKTVYDVLAMLSKQFILPSLKIKFTSKAAKNNGVYYFSKNEIHLHDSYLDSKKLFHIWLLTHEYFHAIQKHTKQPWSVRFYPIIIRLNLCLKVFLIFSTLVWLMLLLNPTVTFPSIYTTLILVSYVWIVCTQILTKFWWEINSNKRTYTFLEGNGFFTTEEEKSYKRFIWGPVTTNNFFSTFFIFL